MPSEASIGVKAAVIREKSGEFHIEDLCLETPRRDEVLVRIAGVGVCHTDLVCRDQYFPVPLPCVFGHEGSGIVESVGESVIKVKPGDRVVLSYLSCGECEPCLEHSPGYCHELYGCNFAATRRDASTTLRKGSEVIHGNFFNQSSFATHALATEKNTVKVPDDVPLDLLGPLGCGVQTGAGAVMNSLNPRPGMSIAIFGCGSVGLAAVMAAKVAGCSQIIAVDPNASRLGLARELGATHAIDPTRGDPIEGIHQIRPTGVHYTLECTGIPEVLRQAVDSLTLTGVCGLIGVSPVGTECAIDMNSIMFGRSLRGIIEGDSVPDVFIPRLVELYKQGRFPFDKLITFYKLEDINKAVEDTEQGKVIKAVLRP